MAPFCSPDTNGHEPTAAPSAIPGRGRGTADHRTPHRDHRRGESRPRAGPAGQIRGLQPKQEPGPLELNRLVPALGGATRPGRCAMRWLSFTPSSRSIGGRWRCSSRLAKPSRRSSPAPSRTANPMEPTPPLPGAGRANDQGRAHRRRGGRRRDCGRDGNRQGPRHARGALNRRRHKDDGSAQDA